MRTPCSHTFLAFILKFLNFLQAFIGVVIIVYSAYMLNQWHHHHNPFPPPNESGIRLPPDIINPLNFASDIVSSRDDALRFNFHSLPAPWYSQITYFSYLFGVEDFLYDLNFVAHCFRDRNFG